MADEPRTPENMRGSTWQMATLIADVKALVREVKDLGEGLKKTGETVRDHDEWIAVREDREKRTARWMKVLAGFVVTFSATAAGSVVYLVLHVKGG